MSRKESGRKARNRETAAEGTPALSGRTETRSRRQRRPRPAAPAAPRVRILAAATAEVAGSAAVPSGSAGRALDAANAEVPAGPLTAVCPAPLRLLAGSTAGTDPQFSPESGSARTSRCPAGRSGAGHPGPGGAGRPAAGSTALKTHAPVTSPDWLPPTARLRATTCGSWVPAPRWGRPRCCG